MSLLLHGDGPLVMVDDNPLDIELAKRYFNRSTLKKEKNYQFVFYESGHEFIDYLKKVKSGEEKMPSLVLLDINMPVMNGFEVLEEIRKDEFFKDLPTIIMFSTASDERNQKSALERGANSFITKPDRGQKFIDFYESLIPES